MDILSKFGLFGCFNYIGGYVDTLLFVPRCQGDVWILGDHFNVTTLKYAGGNQMCIIRC